MFVVIAYDIPNTKRRTKIMKVLQGYGAHAQESVFECDLAAGTYRQLRQRLKALINVTEDNVRFYHLCQADVPRIEVVGVGREVQLIGAYKVV
jgi:CRISPR-associated protein Cas2